jgi:mono/diheme cytochrome c family protein
VSLTCRGALVLALLSFAAPLVPAACTTSRPPPPTAKPDWDRIAFALELVRDEYGEQSEGGDFSAVPALVAVLDGARGTLGAPTEETRALAAALGELRASLVGHQAARTVSRTSARLLADLAKSGQLTRRPPAVPDLRRGAAAYAVACVPCHGPPHGPLPPAAAHMVPPPPTPSAALATPYELFNRITYGGAGTAMPSFADALPERARWDIAFYLFAERWPHCVPRSLPTLAASDLAYLSDFDLWQKYGWGSAPCLRRNFR